MAQQTIQELSSSGRHQECLQACQQLLQSEPENPSPWKYAGKSLLALGQFEKAKQCLAKAHQIDNKDPEIIKDIGNIFNALQNYAEAIRVYKAALSIDQNYAPAINNLGLIAKRQGNLIAAEQLAKRACDLDQSSAPCHMNLGAIYKDLGNLDQALASTLKSLELNPDNPDALINLGGIYRDLGNHDQALASTLKSLELNPDNPDALINLGGIYHDLGNLDKALASTLKSLELKPGHSKALYSLGRIQMTLGKTEEARKTLLNAIENNSQEYAAYYELSTMLETKEQASELVTAINSAIATEVTPQDRSFIEFATSNCLHKAENFGEASKHLQLANKNKLTVSPSNSESLQQEIENNLAKIDPPETPPPVNTKSGKERIFIVGMPRSGSTLLETILSIRPEIKDLGESRSLKIAIAKLQAQKQHNPNHQDLNEIYSQIEPIDRTQHKYTTDKNLYNFVRISFIAYHMPAAKIIHCVRNPMDNILSMHRSNLGTPNNYTANLEDAAKVLAAHVQAMRIQKKRYPEQIFTFDYDQFVNEPEVNLRKLLRWLDLEFDDNYLHPEKSTRSVNTASVMQARKPISNKSVGGWKNYETLLKPAFKIIQDSGIKIE